MTGFVELRTPRLRLRSLRQDDLESFAAMNADAQVMRHFPAPWSRAESEVSLARLLAKAESQGFGVWAVEIPEHTTFAGMVGLNRPDYETPFTPCVEVLWRL